MGLEQRQITSHDLLTCFHFQITVNATLVLYRDQILLDFAKFHVSLKIKSWRPGRDAVNLPGSEWVKTIVGCLVTLIVWQLNRIFDLYLRACLSSLFFSLYYAELPEREPSLFFSYKVCLEEFHLKT